MLSATVVVDCPTIPKIAREFYEQLAEEAEVHGTDASEHIIARRGDGQAVRREGRDRVG